METTSLAASTPTLDSEPGAAPRRGPAPGPDQKAGDGQGAPSAPTRTAARERLDARLLATRIGLAGVTLVALGIFAVYAAYLASQAVEITEATPITVPGQGPSQPFHSGQPAPDFTLATLDGQPVSLSDFAGRPVWINVWATWCAPCRAEIPDINAVYQELQAKAGPTGDDGPVLLMVSLGEQPKDVQQYLESTRYRLPVLVDPEFRFTDHYRVTGLPTHYFIGRDGVIRDLAIGGLKPNAMRARLAKIIQ